MGIFLRWLFAFALIAATYNPTQWSYTRWASTNYETHLSLVVFLGLVLAIGYIIYVRATLRSIGGFGMVLIFALVGTLIWVLYDFGVLRLDSRQLNTLLGILALSVVLGIGLSWSIVRRALSGQADVDDVDE